MKVTTPRSLGECTVVVINDILGTRHETISPWPSREVERCFGAVDLARQWIQFQEGFAADKGDSQPLAASIRTDRRRGTITIRWYPTGDLEAARVCWIDIADGTWGRETGGCSL